MRFTKPFQFVFVVLSYIYINKIYIKNIPIIYKTEGKSNLRATHLLKMALIYLLFQIFKYVIHLLFYYSYNVWFLLKNEALGSAHNLFCFGAADSNWFCSNKLLKFKKNKSLMPKISKYRSSGQTCTHKMDNQQGPIL